MGCSCVLLYEIAVALIFVKDTLPAVRFRRLFIGAIDFISLTEKPNSFGVYIECPVRSMYSVKHFNFLSDPLACPFLDYVPYYITNICDMQLTLSRIFVT